MSGQKSGSVRLEVMQCQGIDEVASGQQKGSVRIVLLSVRAGQYKDDATLSGQYGSTTPQWAKLRDRVVIIRLLTVHINYQKSMLLL